MKKNLLAFLCVITLIDLGFSQDYSNLWEAHYSYLKIVDVTQGNGRIYVASENAVFTYDSQTSELETITTVDGLSGDFISTLHYSETYEMILIGYENGLMEIYIEPEEDVLTVVDIVEKPTIPPDEKRINHFNEYEGLVYISTDYGISVYDLSRLEFGDTYYIGDGGSQIKVNQTAIYNGFIYAACGDSNGLRRAFVDSDNLIDYQEWFRRYVGNYHAVEAIENKLYAVRYSGDIFDISSDGPLVSLYDYQSPIEDVKSNNDKLVVTTRNETFIYNSEFDLILNFSNTEVESFFSSGTVLLDQIYIGTLEKGLISISLMDNTTFTEIYPDGPLRNNAFSIQADVGNLWVTYGEYSLTYFPAGRRYGVSYYSEEEWNNIPFDSLFLAKDLNAISINPFNPQQVFISSFQNGILEINDFEPTILYNETNSGLESLIVPNNPNVVSVRVSGSTFDRQGVLWSVTSRVQRPLKSYDPNTGQWQGYDFSEIIPDGLRDELGFSDIGIDDIGTKWIGALRSGLIGYNENGNLIKNLFDEPNHNMPSTGVFSLAVDNRNQVWIGTNKGLRVLYNTANFLTTVMLLHILLLYSRMVYQKNY